MPPDEPVVLDDVWFTYAEACMEDSLRDSFRQGYADDVKHAPIIEEITKEGGKARPGYPFVLDDQGLLFNVHPDGTRSLCVPKNIVNTVLEGAHDSKHHFGRNRMLYDLKGQAAKEAWWLID
ncbi:hypothetical protein B0T26DRAFT_713906 [Lasiosphaeria miniovina]|uniref:Integrase zinc-binding domain-containing protein n=1 Tax=Lasiosphaeria miniovina TaxID=1954250 RepID=A0AA40AMY9_9PEZI|nr:uncharacterized protein B0T26DRAFT_713906 [Lasiosphaeria miniovina]KAK0718677.1 hypothetical protein B0T26DRAFT_713906 [Lasiosphaeria miniovina]